MIRVYSKFRNLFRQNLTEDILNSFRKLYSSQGYNICFNRRIPYHYDAGKKNILIVLESPEYVLKTGWLRPDMKFIAEISFGNFYKLENYYCCRAVYSGYDSFVRIDEPRVYSKTEKVSFIYSQKQDLTGHKLRFRIAEATKDSFVHHFGFGSSRPLIDKSESLVKYEFQIVVENGKHPEYVSEKLFDCLKTKTIPIYWGGETAIRKMGFDPQGILLFDSVQELNDILVAICNNEIRYVDKAQAIEYNLMRLKEIRKEMQLQLPLYAVLSKYLGSTDTYHDPKQPERLTLIDDF